MCARGGLDDREMPLLPMLIECPDPATMMFHQVANQQVTHSWQADIDLNRSTQNEITLISKRCFFDLKVENIFKNLVQSALNFLKMMINVVFLVAFMRSIQNALTIGLSSN